MKPIGELDIQKKKPQSREDIFFNKRVVVPDKLKILVLSGNDIVTEQLQFIHKCVNLLKLDLSNNRINKISGKIGLQKLGKLQILYLHNNKIENAVGLQGVFMVPYLVHLTIKGNPVQKLPRIQHLIINVLPSLKIIGNRVIFVEERSPEFFQARNNVYIQNQISEGWKIKDNSQALYLKVLNLQLKYFDNVWCWNNPIVFIQRAWKKSLKQKRNVRKLEKLKQQNAQQRQLSPQKSQLINSVKLYFDQWKSYYRNLKSVKVKLASSTFSSDKSYLILKLPQYRKQCRNLRVQEFVKAYVKKIRHKIFMRKMAERICKQLKKKRIQFNGPQSFYQICNINKTHRFYFSKTQLHLLQNFIIHLGNNFKWQNVFKQVSKIGPVSDYLSIRTVDPETFEAKKIYSVFTYSIWPSMKVVFLKKKKYQSKNKVGLINIRSLYYIKNKNIKLTEDQLKKSCKVYKQLQKFYKKQYENTLQYFECKNQEAMKMLLRYIYYHNCKSVKFEKKLKRNDMQSLLQNYQQTMLIYAENILERTAAAVRIQQNWRKYLVNRNSKQSIYAKMKFTRAVMRIQNFWRNHRFYHRLSFQKNIAHQLKLFTTNSFILPIQIYHKIKDICKTGMQNDLYRKLRVFKISPSNKIKCIWEMRKSIYNSIIAKQHFPFVNEPIASSEQIKECDSWHIIHLNANINKVQIGDKQFYEFKFESIQQTKYRIYLISLLSYKCKSSSYLLPLSRQTLDLYHFRMQQYVKMKLLPQPDIDSKTKQNKLNKPKVNKICILKQYQQDGIFISSKDQKIKSQIANPITLQFYQKAYQDFPKKYVQTLYYFLAKQNEQNKAGQQEATKISLEKLIEQNRIDIQITEQIQQNIQQKERKRLQSNKDINITKIDKKRLSLYDFGTKTSQLWKKKDKESAKTNMQISNVQISQKRDTISRTKRQKQSKKLQIFQNKTQNIRKMRENLQKQRQDLSSTKNIKQFERTQELKKKVERIRDMKKRVANARSRDRIEEDFIQQGNFVMEQQLKMVVMREKLQSHTKSRPFDRKKSTDSASQSKSSDLNSKSFYTEQKNRQIKVYDNGSFKPVVNMGATMNISNPIQPSQQISGQEKKIVNARIARRVKSRSIGAYIRDPSMVHGVFPEQFYPIQSSGQTFKFFPRLG